MDRVRFVKASLGGLSVVGSSTAKNVADESHSTGFSGTPPQSPGKLPFAHSGPLLFPSYSKNPTRLVFEFPPTERNQSMPCIGRKFSKQDVVSDPIGAKEELDRVTNLLCDVLTKLDAEGSTATYLRPDGKDWWDCHQQMDVEARS